MTQGTKKRWIKVGDTRNLVIKDHRVVRDDTISRVKRTTVLIARDVAGRCGLTHRLPRRELRSGLLTTRDAGG
jgi:hypothetical protein